MIELFRLKGGDILHFASWMRETREQKRMSAADCASRAGVSQPTWSQWEGAPPEKEWRTPTVNKIADGLGVPRKVALAMAGRMASDKPDELIGQRLGPILERAPANRREFILQTLEEMAQRMVEIPA